MNEPLPARRVGEIEVEPQRERWLIEGLWTQRAVGVLGGPPKAYKTYLALDVALSVASATPSLGRFPVRDSGPVLAYLAEDSEEEVRARTAALARGRGLDLKTLDLFVIDSPVLWLDDPGHRERLQRTIETIQPKLLLLDPLVRLHRQDENDVRSVSALLGFLRELNRTYNLAILLVHHTAKKERAHPGQALRGSGDIYAWLDVGLYLAKRKHGNVLTVEHRSAPAPGPFDLSLLSDSESEDTLRLIVSEPGQDHESGAALDLQTRLLEKIRQSAHPLTRTSLRERLGVRNERLGDILSRLERSGQIRRTSDGWTASGTTPRSEQDQTPDLPFL